MRFCVGIPQVTPGFPRPGDGWVRLGDRHAVSELTIGLLFWAILVVFGLVWTLMVPAGERWWHGLCVAQVVLIPAMVLVHETLHALCYPDGALSSRTIAGVLPKQWGFFVLYDGERSKARTLVAKAMPFLVLSVLPVLLASAHLIVAPAWLRALSTLNGALCVGDLVAIWHVTRGIPNGSVLRPAGIHLWYRPAGHASRHAVHTETSWLLGSRPSGPGRERSGR